MISRPSWSTGDQTDGAWQAYSFDLAAEAEDLIGDLLEEADEAEGEAWRQLLEFCQQIEGYPRHLGIHNGGMVITGGALAERFGTRALIVAGLLAMAFMGFTGLGN